MRPAWCAVLGLLVGCATSPSGTSSTPPAAEDELTTLLKSIPLDCVVPPGDGGVDCPAPFVAPPGACVVQRTDARSGTRTDLLVYVDDRLVHQELTLASNATQVLSLEYDGQQRLLKKRGCFTAGAGEPTWSPSWRPPFAVYDAAFEERVETTLHYDGDAGVPRIADLTTTSGPDAGVQARVCSWYADARRTKRIQTVRDGSPTMQTQVRTYEWTKARLDAIDSKSLALRGTGVVGRKSARVSFIYDEHGRLSALTTPEATTKFGWNAKGQLESAGSARFEWNALGQLSALKLGDPALDGTFTWDTGGRIESALFANGEGYRVTYGPGCAKDFRAAEVTPSTEPFLLYEGKDAL